MRSLFIVIMKLSLFSPLFLMVGCGDLSRGFSGGVGQVVPDPNDPSEVIVIPAAPIEVTAHGVIVAPMPYVKTYQGGEG